MKLFKVIGNVTLARCHPGYRAATLLATEPEAGTIPGQPPQENPDLVVVWDELGAGLGSRIAVSDGAEASQPFRPEPKAVDAYCSAIIDSLYVDPDAVQQLQSSARSER